MIVQSYSWFQRVWRKLTTRFQRNPSLEELLALTDQLAVYRQKMPALQWKLTDDNSGATRVEVELITERPAPDDMKYRITHFPSERLH